MLGYVSFQNKGDERIPMSRMTRLELVLDKLDWRWSLSHRPSEIVELLCHHSLSQALNKQVTLKLQRNIWRLLVLNRRRSFRRKKQVSQCTASGFDLFSLRLGICIWETAQASPHSSGWVKAQLLDDEVWHSRMWIFKRDSGRTMERSRSVWAGNVCWPHASKKPAFHRKLDRQLNDQIKDCPELIGLAVLQWRSLYLIHSFVQRKYIDPLHQTQS